MMINKLVVGQIKFEYPDFLFEYLHSYLFRFSLKNGLYNGSSLNIHRSLLPELNDVIKSGMRDLLHNLYEEPSHKKRSKYGSRYRKISFEGETYIIDFRTDPLGNTSYGMNTPDCLGL